ncbi:MAG: hypothetical protein JJU27_04170 [Gammaproteobacteria bacterium]|nr:hypothetical protein [Gammaproteobacteria bacterium]
MDRRSFLMALGATTCAAGVPLQPTSAGTRQLGVDALLQIIGSLAGRPTWIQTLAQVLEFRPAVAPRVVFAEAAATRIEIESAGQRSDRAFRVTATGVGRVLDPQTMRPLEHFMQEQSGRAVSVPVERWKASMLLSDTALQLEGGNWQPRRAPAVAPAGNEWYVFQQLPLPQFERASTASGAAASLPPLESVGWRVDPAALRDVRVPAGYHHVSVRHAATRPWLDADASTWLLANASGHKVFERARLAPVLAELID